MSTMKARAGWAASHLAPAPAALDDHDPLQLLAVQQTLTRYAFALDQRDLAALEALLTDDVTWAFTVAGEADLGPFAGRTAVLDLVRTSAEAQSDQRRHNLTNFVVRSVGANEAVVHAYLVLTSNAGPGPHVVATGFYTFTLRRVKDQWLIAELFLGTDNAEQSAPGATDPRPT